MCARSDLYSQASQLKFLAGDGVPLTFVDGLGVGRENFEENALIAIPLYDVHPTILAECAWDEWGDSAQVPLGAITLVMRPVTCLSHDWSHHWSHDPLHDPSHDRSL